MNKKRETVFYISGFVFANAKKISKFFFGDFFVGIDKDRKNREWHIRVKKKIKIQAGISINIPLKFAYDSIDASIEKNKDNEIIKTCLTQLKQDFIRKYGEEAIKKEVFLSEFLDVEYFKEFFGPAWIVVYDSSEKV